MMHISYQNRILTPHKSNGVSVFAGIFISYCLLSYYGYWPKDWAYHYFWDTFLVANTLSFLLALFLFIQTKLYYHTRVNSFIGNIKLFWKGITNSPQIFSNSIGLVELNRIGLILCSIITISLATHQYQREVFIEYKPAISLYLSIPLLSYIIILFLWIFEQLHLEIQMTYSDYFLEQKVGWKEVWWRTCIIPFYYCYPIIFLTSLPSYFSLSPLFLLIIISMFLFGYWMYRGTIYQNFTIKTGGSKSTIWGDRPIVVEFNKPKNEIINNSKQKRLLVSGWRGVMRHPSYVGLFLIITSFTLLSLSIQFSQNILLFWIAGCIYLIWSIHRKEIYRKEKYGNVWGHYCHCVPYKIVPYIY